MRFFSSALGLFALGVVFQGCLRTPCDDGSFADFGVSCPDAGNPSEGVALPDGGIAGCTPACTAGVCVNGTCVSGCLIEDSLVPSGTLNPQNPCESCEPTLSTIEYSTVRDGAACDDLSVCTTGDACAAGVCQGGPLLNCDDGNPCTTDSCGSQGCAHAANTFACDDGDGCTTGDVCSQGVCLGPTPLSCDDANPCTVDSCTAQGCTQTTQADGTSCPLGICVGGNCSAGCFIDGGVVPTSSPNPLNACQVCSPAQNTGAYTPRANGTVCDDGNACTAQASCTFGTCGGGAPINCDDQNPCTHDSCDPATGCFHTQAANGLPCNSGLFCNSGSCQPGCFIGGTFFSDGTTNPSNTCQACNRSLKTTAWSTLSNGASCLKSPGQNGTCTSGTCK